MEKTMEKKRSDVVLKDQKSSSSAKRCTIPPVLRRKTPELQRSYQLFSNEGWMLPKLLRFNIDSYTFGIEFSEEAATG